MHDQRHETLRECLINFLESSDEFAAEEACYRRGYVHGLYSALEALHSGNGPEELERLLLAAHVWRALHSRKEDSTSCPPASVHDADKLIEKHQHVAASFVDV